MPTVSGAVYNASGEEMPWSASWTDGPPPPAGQKVVGMSAAKALWPTRLTEVGRPGVTARRIFTDLNSTGSDQQDVVQYCHDNGIMPVYSFKVPSIADALDGAYDTWVTALAVKLAAHNKLTAVSFHHEPNPEVAGADFCALHRRWAPILKRGQVKFGPILNGWLLDNKVSTWNQYAPADLLGIWDYLGFDIYQVGERDTPSTWGEGPARGVRKAVTWLAGQGKPTMPILIGEYNGYTAAAIEEMGQTMLVTPQLWAGLVFNSDVGAKGLPLTGDRLAAYKATKADPRVKQ